MRKFINEFKEFINRGNVMDMAVGVIIGGAFTSIVTALTNNIINPLISVVAGGAFISACINFLIVAFVVFCLVKALNKAKDLSEKLTGAAAEQAAEEPAPVCPFCLEEHKPGATRCPHCGSDLTQE